VNGKDLARLDFQSIRPGERENIMGAALVTRTAMITGLESACLTLGTAEEPAV